ncbi:unnamed protein product [Mytilus coruscus]|uniref:Fucolectin tachylectin-4 pentraxin-1 domain-containing protein n=1 Tax=Mytilus coruscus TaxID=42192 RepID=A0A6J8BBC8_MYTCO|nr:unnamed protein product [Mytilus coruscus]
MWMNKDNLNPCEWGWKVANGNLVPVKCTMDAAPSKLLNIIRCNSKTNCDTKRCTCRKNGLECSVACGECKGTGSIYLIRLYLMDIEAAEMLAVLLTQTTFLLTVTAQHNLTPFGTASQSSLFGSGYKGKPTNAVNPPISNHFSLNICAHTNANTHFNYSAWCIFQFSYGSAYITDITIYYRENYEDRMDGFKLYVTNTSTIPPVGYLCYEDTDPGLPNITQTLPCNQLGQYVICYDTTGSIDSGFYNGPLVELCYVAINGHLQFSQEKKIDANAKKKY